MAIDPYASCPGGTGKKIKFCCPDLLAELEKIDRMLTGNQRRACLDHLLQIEPKYPNRACLTTLKADLQAELGDLEQADATLRQLMQTQPDNPVALAEMALVQASRDGGQAGIDPLQKAIAAGGREMSRKVYDAIGELAQLLLAEGHLPAARGHLLMQLRINPKDETALQLLLRLNSSPAVSLLLKDDQEPLGAPADAPWKNEFEAAMSEARRGAWSIAARKLLALAERAPSSPVMWNNLAMLRGWLADEAGAVDALRRYAALDVPLDDAVEAEAKAQILDPDPPDLVDDLRVTFPIRDMERLSAALLSDKRAARLPVEAFHPAHEDQPPPKSAFWLLDRPVPATGVGITAQDIPNIIGRAFLFGRETDREARLEVEAYHPDLPAIRTALSAIAPGSLGDSTGEEVMASVPRTQTLLSWNWRLPEDTPQSEVPPLLVAQRRLAVLERWPQTKFELLGGRTPLEAVSDASQRIKLLAAILHVELALDAVEAHDLANELRGKLGLPVAGPIDPTGIAVEQVPQVRFVRLIVEKLSDEDLTQVYQRAMFTAARAALRKLAVEMLGRKSLEGKFDRAAIFGLLAGLETDADQAIKWLGEARSAAEKARQSCARWDMEEFALRLRRGDVAESSQLLQHLQSRHGKEPGVRQALMQLLYEAGIIGPDGRPVAQAGAEAAGIVVPGAQAAPAGKLWTPGGDASPAKKSALWTPGMD